MNIMQINDTTFGAKISQKPLTKIQTLGNVDNYVKQMLNSLDGAINYQANAYGRDMVKFAQKGNTLFINSGTITSSLNMKNMEHESDMFRSIITNIQANSEVRDKGLAKAMKRLFTR